MVFAWKKMVFVAHTVVEKTKKIFLVAETMVAIIETVVFVFDTVVFVSDTMVCVSGTVVPGLEKMFSN